MDSKPRNYFDPTQKEHVEWLRQFSVDGNNTYENVKNIPWGEVIHKSDWVSKRLWWLNHYAIAVLTDKAYVA